MKNYDYLEAMAEDIKNYIKNNVNLEKHEDKDELEQFLNDELFTEDGVTGNASGSYTFCRQTAKEYVIDNTDLLQDAISEFCIDAKTVTERFLSEDWEYFDVTIRCYLLGQAIGEALDEMELDF